MSLRSWWKRLWQPGEPQPEFIFGKPVSGEAYTIAACNVTEISYYAISPSGKRLPIMTTDGCPLNQHVETGRVYVTPSDLACFMEIIPVCRVEDPSLPASIECG